MTLRKEKSFARFLRRNGAALLLSAGLFALVYAVVFHFRTGAGNYDYLAHGLWAIAMSPQDILSSFYDGSEHLWHVCVKLLYMAGVSNLWAAVALVTAAADTAAYFLIYKTWEQSLSEKLPRWLLACLTAAPFLVSSLTLPGHSFYAGQGAVNTWHNPTNIMVRPFAAAVFYMTVKIYNRRRYGVHTLLAESGGSHSFAFEGSFWAQFRQPVYTRAELVLYPLCLLLSAYAKPSFLQFFAPAILIFLLIDVIRTKGKLFPFCVKLALAYLPAAVILLSQFSGYFGGSVSVGSQTDTVTAAVSTSASSGIAIYYIQQSFSSFWEVLRETGDSLLKLLYPCAFPLFILIAGRCFHCTDMRLGFTSLAAAWLESNLLHETGERATHGNFLWGLYLSAWLLWTVSIGRYAQLIREKTARGKITLYVGTPLLAWHLIAGVTYIVRIFQTGEYYF